MRSPHAALAALAGVVALVVLPGCTEQASRGAQAGGAAVRAAEGGCGGTPLLEGAKPKWTSPAGTDSLRVPYTLSDNGDVAAFLFGHPLQAREPEGYADKILWVLRLPRGGQPLHITGRPLGADGPTFEVTEPADSGPGEIYPSYVVAPEPGCWHFTLRWNGHVDAIDLYYVAEREPA
ncbi:MAG: hypothetical protein GEV03_01480 [Streptosporangiales bacterium]|nr:hypothetical protein [Streptosporangiales bacterium]